MLHISLAPALKRARKQAAISQETMAERLHVSERTIRTIENTGGEVEASINLALNWLDACGENPLPFFRELLQPEIYKPEQELPVQDIRQALAQYIMEEAGELELRQLYFAMHGKHGSSWIAWLQKGVADLHNPLPDRYSAVELIRSSFLRAQRLGKLVCPEEPMPVMALLDAAIDNSREAIYSGRGAYSGAVKK